MQYIVTCATGMFSYICINSFLNFQFLTATYHPDTPYLREQGCDDPWVLSKPKWSAIKRFGKHWHTRKQECMCKGPLSSYWRVVLIGTLLNTQVRGQDL